MLAAGRIAKLFGVKGEVSLSLYADFPQDFDWKERPVFTQVDSLVVPLFFDEFARKGASGAVAIFADLDTPERAAMVVGKEFFLDAEEEDSLDGDFSPADLIGFEVHVGRRKGRITDFYDNDINPLFEIELDSREHLVPAVEEFIADIDPERQIIKLQLPEGLLEL